MDYLLAIIDRWLEWFKSSSKLKGAISLKSYTPMGYVSPGVIVNEVCIKEENAFIIAEIRNTGHMKTTIPSACFYFKIYKRSIVYKLSVFLHIPFINRFLIKKHCIFELPYMNTNPPQLQMHIFPCAIESRNQQIFMTQFDQQKIPSYDKKLWDIKAFIYTAEGKEFELKISRELRNKILVNE